MPRDPESVPLGLLCHRGSRYSPLSAVSQGRTVALSPGPFPGPWVVRGVLRASCSSCLPASILHPALPGTGEDSEPLGHDAHCLLASQANQPPVRFSSPGAAPRAQARPPLSLWVLVRLQLAVRPPLEQKWGSVIKGDGGLSPKWTVISVHHPSLPRGLDITPMLPLPRSPQPSSRGP